MIRLFVTCACLFGLASLCHGSAAGAVERDVVQINKGWKMTPLQTSGARPPASVFRYGTPLGTDGEPLPWEPVRLPTVHGFYDNAPASAFPIDKHANYWYGAVKKNVYNWAWYEYVLDDPKLEAGSRLLLKFMAVAWESRVWVNGALATQHKGSFTGFEVDITPYLKADGQNVIRVLAIADFGEYPMQRVYGKMFSASANMGGIIGGVELVRVPAVYVKRSLVNVQYEAERLYVEDWIENTTGEPQTVELEHRVVDAEGKVFGRTQRTRVLLEPGLNRRSAVIALHNPPQWSPQEPNLLTVCTEIYRSGRLTESHDARFGFRDFSIRDDDFFLNGERIRLYLGNILTYGQFDLGRPADVQRLRRWLRRQKALNVNTIRYHMAGIDSDRFMAICDEEGMLVINEWPWFHRVEWSVPEGPARENFFRNNDAEMAEWLYRDFNNPSNIIWSLANEVWTVGEIPLLSHTYGAMDALDASERPKITSSGFHSVIRNHTLASDVMDFHNYSTHSDYPWGLMHESLERDYKLLAELYPQGHGPVIISEALNVPRLPRRELPEITNENYPQYANLQWVREAGVRSLSDPERAYDTIVGTMGLRTLEKFRREGRLAGFSPWFGNRNHLPEAIANIYGPYFVGLAEYLPNLQSGTEQALGIVAMKDPLKAVAASVRVSLLSAAGDVLAEDTVALALPENIDVADAVVRLNIPQAEGAASIRLQLFADNGEQLSQNEYGVFIFDEGSPELAAADAVLPIGLLASQAGSRVAQLLAQAGVPVVTVGEIASLGKSGIRTLILAEGWRLDDREDERALREWVSDGGNLFAFESDTSGAVAGLEGFGIVRSNRTRQNFVDLVAPEHPVFNDLSPEQFGAWNGDDNLIVTSMISPLSTAAVAAAGSYTPEGQLAVIMEAVSGKGRVFSSQLDAISRYDSDPAARRYVHNVLGYALGGNYATAPQPEGSKLSRFIEETSAISPDKFNPLNLRPVLNSPLVRTVGDASALDYHNLPAGVQNFLGVPFDIVAPSDNGNRSVLVMQGNMLPGMPQRVEDIVVNRNVSVLYFLQAAFYPSSNVMARYRVNYDNGTSEEIIIDGSNVGDWYNPRHMADAFVAWSDAEADSPTVGLYLFRWQNSHPELKVRSLDVISEGAEQHSSGSLMLLGITAR